ncbi:MAG: hypothetical protein NTZ55_02970 [Candidatus Roizmanbacteria bacterium]|nr:hypothetical protein [Candidatus Roizmanbacteria bacterium]
MSKSAIKFYVIPGVIALLIIIVLLLIPINNKKTEVNNSPIPTIGITLPTKTLIPDTTIPPTLIPPQPFTGAEINQELPQDLKTVGEQKTALRRITPLTLAFGTIEFDYVNDIFLVRLAKPNDQSTQLFVIWREQNYPALTDNKFIFN